MENADTSLIGNDAIREYRRTPEGVSALIARLEQLGIHSSHYNTEAEYLAGNCNLETGTINKKCAGAKKCRVHIHNYNSENIIVWTVCE